MKKILKIIKRIIFAFLILYGFNTILSNMGVIIPINIPTLASITFLGIPGFVSLLVMFFLTK